MGKIKNLKDIVDANLEKLDLSEQAKRNVITKSIQTKKSYSNKNNENFINNETEETDSNLNIKQKFIFKPRFILNAIASIVIIAILLNVAFFKGVFNKNVIPISPMPSNSSLPVTTPNNDSKKSPIINTTPNSAGRIVVGDSNTILYSIIKSKDGGFVTIGRQDKGGSSDAIIKKLDNVGNIEWAKSYGGNGFNEFRSVIQTDDGGYIAVGESEDINTHSSLNAIIYKLDSEGNIEWSKTLDDIDVSNINIDVKRLALNKIIQTADKDFVIVGDCNNFRGAIMIKLNSSGKKIWEVIYNGSLGASFSSVKQLDDGGLLVIGYSNSTDGDFIDKVSSDYGGVVVKFDSSGKKLWSQYSLFGYSYGSIVQISNGEILVSGCLTNKAANRSYATLTKYSNDGNTLWEENYDESFGYNDLSNIFINDENSIIGNSYPYICKFDNNGKILWKSKYSENDSGNNHINVISIIQLSEDGYVACGKGYEDERACIFFFDSTGKLK